MSRSYEERRFTIVVADFLSVALPAEVLWSHFPAGEARSEKTGALLKRMGLKRGWPDFVLILPGGIAAFLELKVRSGRLTTDQRDHQWRSEALGAKWAVCRSLDDVAAALTAWGVKLKVSL